MSGIVGFSFTSTVGNYDTAANWTTINGQYAPGPVVPYSYSNIVLGANTQQMNVTGNDVFGGLYANGAVAGGGGNTINVSGSFTGPIDQFNDYTLLVQSGGQVNAANATFGSATVLDNGSIAISYGFSATSTGITIANHAALSDGGAISLTGSSILLQSGGSLQVTGLFNASAGSNISLQSSQLVTIGGSILLDHSTLTQDSGGVLRADGLGLAAGDVVTLNGSDTFLSGGGISGTGGALVIGANGKVSANEISLTSGTTLIVDGTLNLTSTGGQVAGGANTVNSGGVVNMGSGEDTNNDVWHINGGTFIDTNGYENSTFIFSGTGGLLDLSGDSQTNTGVTITGFNVTDALILGPITGTGEVTPTIVNGNTLELLQGGSIVGEVYNFTLATGVSISQIKGTISNGHYVVNHCFYPGTKLATAEGEIEVQEVAAGTMLKTESGAVLPVRWVGWSEISTRFADPLCSLPIRIRADALADGVPSRDLLVSPDHAIGINGLLVQAAALVNGTSIFREENVPDSFRYYHVELATHELLLAENCPAESFVDNVDRMNFHNWDAREAPTEAVPEMDCPRAKSARQVPAAIHAAITARTVNRAA